MFLTFKNIFFKRKNYYFLFILVFQVLFFNPQPFAAVSKNTSWPFSYPMVIGHRGASGVLPEHTLESYTLAIQVGADFIEPDTVSTKDGVLVVRHDVEIGETTNVQSIFPNRKTSRIIDGKNIIGWFIDDFTYAEVKQLRARQRVPSRDQSFNDQFEIPTLEQVIELAAEKSKTIGRTIGVYIETKHPTYFKTKGLALEDKLVALLNKYSLNQENSPIIIQSFEVSNLIYLNNLIKVRKMQLIGDPREQPYDFAVSGDKRTYLEMLSQSGLMTIASYAQIIGPAKQYILPSLADGSLIVPTPLIRSAHALGIEVHPYTFKQDPGVVSSTYEGDLYTEIASMFALGADAVFSDWPQIAANVKRDFLYNKERIEAEAENKKSDDETNLEVSVFDFDDTLMTTDAKLYLYHKTSGKEIALSTAQFALFGKPDHFSDYQLKEPLSEFSFREIFDIEGRNQFSEQLMRAVQLNRKGDWQAPAWRLFENNLIKNSNNQYLLSARNNSRNQVYEGFLNLHKLGLINEVPPLRNFLCVGHPEARTAGMGIPEAKLYELRDIATQLQQKAKLEDKVGVFRFYDDKFATIEFVWSSFEKELDQFQNVKFEINYVGYQQPAKPFMTISMQHGKEISIIEHRGIEKKKNQRTCKLLLKNN